MYPGKLLAAAALVLFLGFAGAANAAAAEPTARLPLRPIGEHGLVLVDLEVGGERHPFLVDTAGGLTVLAPELASRAGCEPFGRLTGFRSDGGRLDVPRCEPARLTVAGRERSVAAAILDLAALGLPGIGGLVSLATFEGERFTLDLAARELIFESDASFAERIAAMRELEVRAARQAGGAGLDLFVAIASPRGRLWLELDSGNAGALLLAPHALAQLGLEIGGDAATSIELDFVGLGPTRVDAIRSERIYDGLIHAGFFAGHVVTFDLRDARPRAWAVKRETPPPAAEAR